MTQTPAKEIDYKASLLLPKTDFPMRAGLPKREPELLAKWQRLGIYDKLRQKPQRPPFILHDGPPYANGHLHIGHALNKILKDMVVRSRQMMGSDSRYVPGWDCHGLPIEWKIEEKYRERGVEKDGVPIVDLRRECRQFAEKWIKIQKEEFQRLGVTGNWDDPYLTMNFHAEAVIASEFLKFVMNGTLYQGSKPVLWSTVEKTALAEAEVEYHDHRSTAIWVKFPLDFGASNLPPGHGISTPASVLIWTTTPWTIPSNRAICFNPEIRYGIYTVTEAAEGNWVACGDTLLVADKLADEIMANCRVTSFVRKGAVPTSALSKMICVHPFNGQVPTERAESDRWDFEIPLLPGGHVTDDAGTGFVHTAPSHGEDDYQIGIKHGLAMTHNVLEDGRFRDDLPLFGGMEIFTRNGKEGSANKEVVGKLVEAGMLAARKPLTHSYPHSWRSKAPLIFRNTPQWFASIDKNIDDGMGEYGNTIRERALQSIDKLVAWIPPQGRNRIRSMVKERPDWVLSRQRAWGVPLTCFVRKGAQPQDSDFLLRDERVNARIIEVFESEGADAWYFPDAKNRFLRPDYDPEEFDQVFDILDVWFDSGSTHAFVLKDRADGSEDGLADLYLEGTDQHRGWFHSSLLQGCGTRGRAPYHGVLTHGFTLDENGMKMAKSLGNTVAPEKVIKQYGADILRLWVAQCDYTADLRIGSEILKGVADGYRRLRNSFRFILGNLHDFSDDERVDYGAMPELEQWVLHRTATLDREVRAGYSKYDFQGTVQAIFNFATSDLSAFYFDIRKDVLYCETRESASRKACRTVLDILFHRLTAWLAPVLVFTMDEVWRHRYSGAESSVHLNDFPTSPEDWINESLAKKWSAIRKARRVVTACLELQRQEKVIGASLEAAPIAYIQDNEVLDMLKSVPFEDVCITSELSLSNETAPSSAFTIPEIPNIGVVFKPAHGEKCRRCWKVLPEVGSFDLAGVCGRCASALS